MKSANKVIAEGVVARLMPPARPAGLETRPCVKAGGAMGLDFGKLAWTGVAFAALVLIAGVSPALGIQPTVEKITQEADGNATYHFKIKIDETIRVEGQGKEPNPDFFTIFNFTGMVPGSEKQPPGWMFSTSTNGITPYRGGRTVLSPADIEGVPNLTWSRTGATIEGPAEISGFSVRTTVKDAIVGEYGSQVTRKSAGTLTPGAPADLKEARIGSITTPKLPSK